MANAIATNGTHKRQERYADTIIKLMRKQFNIRNEFSRDYEGSPVSGAVNVPTRNGDIVLSDYDILNGITMTQSATDYVPILVDTHKAFSELVDGYEAEAVPDNLKAQRLESASYVVGKALELSAIKALINVNNISDAKVGENTLKDIPLIAYDENGDPIELELVPSKVSAVINIESPSKTVPLRIVPTGVKNIVFGKAISSIKANVEQVTIYGSESVLNEINEVQVKIDVSDIKGSKKYTKTIKKPTGIREISSKTVTVEISIDDEASTEVSGVRLSYINLGSNYTVQATESSTTEIPVILKGVKSVIENITATDIEAYVDLKDLGVGEHEVEVKVKGNDSKITYTPKITKVKIQIADKQ